MHKLFFLLLLFSSLYAAPDVVVSIPPTKYLVERIAGEHITVETLVPRGADPHTYEPTSRQVIAASNAKIWFRIGEGFERTRVTLMKNAEHVDLQKGIDLLPSCPSCPHAGFDTHTWLSPRLLIVQAHLIEKALSRHFPESASLFSSNLIALEKELLDLDTLIQGQLASHETRLILVTHPAFSYFCRDYNFFQMSIEADGKEPSPKYLTNLLFEARKRAIKTIFIEPEHEIKGAIRLASELGAVTVSVDPYKENVIENLKEISSAFAKS